MPQKAIRYLVTGRVQGVFYRASAASKARELDLNGWARNLPDGSVEVVVSGSDRALAALGRWLWKGPPAARVDRVNLAEWPHDVPAGFTTH